MSDGGVTPIYRVYKDGVDISSNFNDRSLSIQVECQNQDFGDRLEISLDDRDGLIAFPQVGAQLSVFLGYAEVGLASMGRFRIEEVVLGGPPQSVTIVGNSTGLATAIAAPEIESFEGQTIGDIVKHLGSKVGLPVEVHPSLAGVEIPFLNQITSASHLLGEISRNFGGAWKIMDGRLIIAPRDAGRSISDTSIPVLNLERQHFARWEARHNSRTEFSGVESSYFDPVDNVRKWVSETPVGDAFQGLVGAVPFRMGQLFASETEAKSAAAAKMSGLVRGSATFTATLAAGDPWIRDQQRLLVSGLRDGANGSWVVSRASHSFSSEAGLQTTLEATVNGLGQSYDAEDFLDDVLRPLPGEVMGRLIVGSNGMIAGGV